MSRTLIMFIFIFSFSFTVLITPVFADTSRIRPDETQRGRLELTDDQLIDDDCYYDTYMIDCELGILLTITQTSDEIDSYLIVKDPNGIQRDNDDYTDNHDSQLTVLINQPGQYEILCTSYSQETGRYEVTVEEIIPPSYFGIFVGIEEYGSELDDTPLCDEDAQNLFDAFVESGLMDRANGIVLTNQSAEVDDIEDAFDDMRRVIGPDDVFIFFYSGHGNQVEASSRHREGELDGLNETLALNDGDLIDDDLAELLEELDAKLAIVVIDACHGGGIADDVVNRPGVVCFASSEEDTLSYVAPELDAGGYLSVFFREAIMGDGDLDGDGMIMVGELAHFILRRFYQECPDPDVAATGYQEFVHKRGLVSQDTVFCWWTQDSQYTIPELHDGDCEGPDESEPNNYGEQANLIAGLEFEGYACEEESDWFVLEDLMDIILEITLHYDENECDIDLEVWSDDELIGLLEATASPDSDIFKIPGQCFLHVYTYDGEGSYFIEIEPVD